MATMLDHSQTHPQGWASSRTGLLAVAGLASLGAGAIHAVAVGVHAESRPAALAFIAVAILQLGWGALALLRPSRLVALLGVFVGIGALAGWAVAKTAGISFIDGMGVAEPVQAADALAAGLAAASAVLVAVFMSQRSAGLRFGGRRAPMSFLSVGVVALTVFGMSAAGSHVHDHGAGGHGDHEVASGGGHDHGDDVETASAGGHGDGHEGDHGDGHEGDHSAYEPVPYDPTQPIDLGGTPGVTPEQQAGAGDLVAITLHDLPQWSDPAVAEAAGFRSIGDGATGVEHFVNEEFQSDGIILDPDRPESLVYNTEDGGRRLVAAMYMVAEGTPLGDVPDVGGDLMQWHTHENLCYNAEGKVAGITDTEGNCAPGLVKPVPTPMIHVWIEPHECGPFAALEGIGGGRVPDGEEKLCDHAHGS